MTRKIQRSPDTMKAATILVETVYFYCRCDLIFVFFDPIGQALCKRTLNIVEHLNEFAGDKMR